MRATLIAILVAAWGGTLSAWANPRRSHQRRWWPDASRWKRAARAALGQPETWVPLVGAAFIAAGGWDEDIVEHASDSNPLFGSQDEADTTGDMLLVALEVGMYASAVAVSDESAYVPAMLKRTAVEFLGTAGAASAGNEFKHLAGRERPNGGKYSFPSDHSTRAFAFAGMTRRNIDALQLNPFCRKSLKLASTSAAAATAWARVEANAHYPTDVLAGAGLGNLVSVFLHDAFLGEDCAASVQTTADGHVMLVMSFPF